MPQLLQKDVRKMVGACPCPDPHKAQLETALLSVQGLNLAGIAKIIQTIEQYAVKYGPQIWADIQVLLTIFGGGTTPADPTPAPAPGPVPAQVAATNPRGLIVPMILALVLLFAASQGRAAERLPISQLALAQNMLPSDCPCGQDCPCGPNCQCGSKVPCGVFVSREREVDGDSIVMLAPDEESGPLQQAPKLPQNQAAPAVAAPAVAAPTFHYETRTRCGAFGCRPYTVICMDPQPAGLAAYAGPTPGHWYGSTVQSYSYPMPAATQTCQTCATATFASDGSGTSGFAGRKGFVQRFREWRAARHTARVRGGGGCSSCGG